MCPRPARILVHSVMNGRGIWFLCRSVRCAPPPLNWSCIPVPIVQRLLVCCPWRSRVPAYVCGSMRACAGGRSVPLVGANRFDFILPIGGAGVPLLRCAARRRVRIGCVVSPVPLRCPAGSPPYALCVLKWAFWRVWRGVGVYIAMSRGRAVWLHCVPAARPAGARLRARGVPVMNKRDLPAVKLASKWRSTYPHVFHRCPPLVQKSNRQRLFFPG